MSSGHIMDKQAVLNWPQGHARANEYLEQERMATLASLTPEQARALFVSLCLAGKALAEAGGNLDKLERLKIERLTKRRRTLDRLATRSAHHD